MVLMTLRVFASFFLSAIIWTFGVHSASAEMETISIFFQRGQTELTPLAADNPKLVLERIQKKGGVLSKVQVVGHADTSHDDTESFRLSAERASIVVVRLIELGVEPRLIEGFFFGENRLKEVTRDNVKEPLNRRVEIFFHY